MKKVNVQFNLMVYEAKRILVQVLVFPAAIWLRLVSGLCGVKFDLKCEDKL